jgi:site-specific DNA-methyltransferase (adenine-specific)
MSAFTLHHGDCLDVLRGMESASVDAIVTDPPYGLSFMGKRWDYDVPSVDVWAECLRVLKPGGHLLAFAGTRTQHRMAVRIEDAGFEIRDMIAWVYGSGFPKSHDVSKAIDKAAGATPIDTGIPSARHNSHSRGSENSVGFQGGVPNITAPATEAARQWKGWGTALKPALETITVARKPLSGTVAETVLAHGTGALNIDGCRVGMSATDALTIANMGGFGRAGFVRTPGEALNLNKHPMPCKDSKPHELGRWPANLIHDGSEEPAALLGDAARFFYCAKASKRDRDEGCDGLEARNNMRVNGPRESEDAKHATLRANHHPTVKPTDLMRYLCRLVTPPGGVVLDPFTGSGSTGKAAMLEGFRFIGIEREAEYVEIARARIQAAILPLMAA